MPNKEKTLGYVRVVVGEDGKVAHICPNTLHHPDPAEQERLNKVVTVEMLDKLLGKDEYEDCQVLVVFSEDKDGLNIAHSMMIQPEFKNFWRERITGKIEKKYTSLRDEIHVQSRIDLWEDTYKESFVPTREVN